MTNTDQSLNEKSLRELLPHLEIPSDNTGYVGFLVSHLIRSGMIVSGEAFVSDTVIQDIYRDFLERRYKKSREVFAGAVTTANYLTLLNQHLENLRKRISEVREAPDLETKQARYQVLCEEYLGFTEFTRI